MFAKLRAALGDVWFYSIALFIALRLADLINIFINLYLVPRYVNPAELGGVLPLASFATMLALPAYVFALTFTKEVNLLSERRLFGQLKSLLLGVFTGLAILLALTLGAMLLWLPNFLVRIRLANGTLGMIVILSAFVGCISPIFMGAIQALKKFKCYSIISLMCAPVRLVTTLMIIPFRPLVGYFGGRATPGLFQILAALFCLRRELAIKAERYWQRPTVRRLARVFVLMGIYQSANMLNALIGQTVIRQHLPDADSAAYYLISRFSDVTLYLTGTLVITLFPYTAELAERRLPTRPLVIKSSAALIIFGALLTLPFVFWSEAIISCLPNGSHYTAYAQYTPWLILINVLLGIATFHANTEASACRWQFLFWWIPVHLGFAAAIHLFPRSLDAILWYFTAHALTTVFFSLSDLIRQKPNIRCSNRSDAQMLPPENASSPPDEIDIITPGLGPNRKT